VARALAEEPAVFADAVDLHGGPEVAMGVEPPATGRTEESEEAPAQRRSESPSFIERFAHLVPEDGEPVAAPEAPHREPASSAPRGSSDEDDSIDEYMRKLMERVRGSNETPSAPVERVKPSAVETSVAGAAPEPVEAVALAPSPEPVAPLKDLSEIRRLPSREVTTDLGALRQLANQSARQAIDVAQTRQSRERASLRLVLSCVSLGCGALAAITASSPFGAQFVGGVLAAAGGGWFGVRTLRSCQTASVKAEHDALASSDR
jgi:hypothetical protein